MQPNPLEATFAQSLVASSEGAMVTYDPQSGTLDVEDWDMEGFDALRGALIASDWPKIHGDPTQPLVKGPQWHAALPYLSQILEEDNHHRIEWKSETVFISITS